MIAGLDGGEVEDVVDERGEPVCELSRMPRLYSIWRGLSSPKYWLVRISAKPMMAFKGVRSS